MKGRFLFFLVATIVSGEDIFLRLGRISKILVLVGTLFP